MSDKLCKGYVCSTQDVCGKQSVTDCMAWHHQCGNCGESYDENTTHGMQRQGNTDMPSPGEVATELTATATLAEWWLRRQELALRNCLQLASRLRHTIGRRPITDEDLVHFVRFCADAGVVHEILRREDVLFSQAVMGVGEGAKLMTQILREAEEVMDGNEEEQAEDRGAGDRPFSPERYDSADCPGVPRPAATEQPEPRADGRRPGFGWDGID